MTDVLLDVLTYIGGFLLLVGIFAFSVWRAGRRDREWPAVARLLGLTYTARDDAALGRFGAMKILDAVGPRSLSNVMSGTRDGFSVWLADYKYSNQLTGTVQRSGFTLCVLQHDRLAVPHFFLEGRGKPRSMTVSPQLRRPDDDPEAALGEDSPLARSFHLRTSSAAAVLELLTPALQDLICNLKGGRLDVEAQGGTLIVTRRTWIAPRDAAAFLDDAARIAGGLLESASRTREEPRASR